MKLSSNKNIYKNCVGVLLTSILRRIERYLNGECQIKIEPLSGKLVKALTWRLVNPGNHFDSITHQHFITFVKYLYEFEVLKPDKPMMIELYIKIVELSLNLGFER